MANPFSSPRATLRRAKQHVDDFHLRTIAFRNNKNWTYVIEDNPDRPGEAHKIKFDNSFFEELPGIVFDAAGGLRAVLDQTGYAAAIAGGVTAPKAAYFPIAETEADLANVIGRKRCKDLPPEILSLFRGSKPYKAGNDLLWSLNRLANTKKHAILTPIQLDRYTVAFEVPGLKIGFHHRWDAEKNEVTLLGWDAKSNFDNKDNFTFGIAFDHPEQLIAGSGPVALLRGMTSEVQRVLMATEAECRRIGLIQ